MIRIQNIYYMLSYAFQVLNEKGYKKVATEDFENVADLYASILIKGVSSQIRRGLGKEYIFQSEELPSPRGRIDVSKSIQRQSMLRKQLVCNFDEFSTDCYMNRILKTTMMVLFKNDISVERKKQLKKLLIYFDDVKVLNVHEINWHLQFNRNNQEYRMLISICYLVLKGLLQTNTNGNTKLMEFLDDQKMHRLYQNFIFNYYKKEHQELNVSASQIKWNLDNDYAELLPVMQSDIILRKEEKTLIIDAKFYSHATQTFFGNTTNHSANLYQIFTYVKNLDKEKTGNVSGLLLYAKTDDDILPDNHYQMDGNRISVETLDLDADFSAIRERLDKIVKEHFKNPSCA